MPPTSSFFYVASGSAEGGHESHYQWSAEGNKDDIIQAA